MCVNVDIYICTWRYIIYLEVYTRLWAQMYVFICDTHVCLRVFLRCSEEHNSLEIDSSSASHRLSWHLITEVIRDLVRNPTGWKKTCSNSLV